MQALVIDDATTIRKFHRGILEQAGFQVDEAHNGIEALEWALAATTPPDLLLVDINMPRMSGYAFLEAVRNDPALHDIPAIVISTDQRPSDQERAFTVGANLFLAKPVQPEVLARFARMLAGAPRTPLQ